jgi:Glucose-6-phosphate dehydrogenase, NAD binding domain
MSTATGPGESTAAADSPSPADVFVVFGITGDLAKVMTFHSLYPLESRALLDCPIVGVAADDWTVEHLREHARKCVQDCGETIDDEVFDRFVARLSYLSGDFADEQTYESVADAIGDASSPVFYLEIPPSLFGMVIKGLANAGLTDSARVVVEKPFGHDVASAAALDVEVHRSLQESQVYRIDHFPGKMGLVEILYLRFANMMFEPIWKPQLHHLGADHDGGELWGGGPWPLLRPGGGVARRGRQSRRAASARRGSQRVLRERVRAHVGPLRRGGDRPRSGADPRAARSGGGSRRRRIALSRRRGRGSGPPGPSAEPRRAPERHQRPRPRARRGPPRARPAAARLRCRSQRRRPARARGAARP